MGKIFTATHADKKTAIRLVNTYAKNYKKGKCYTIAKENNCTQNEQGLWVCKTEAHHHCGSCAKNRKKIDPDNKCSWYIGLPRFKTFIGLKEEAEFETYEDALPEDYILEE